MPEKFDEKALQEALDKLKMLQTRLMLETLAHHLTENTKKMAVPSGTRVWHFVDLSSDKQTIGESYSDLVHYLDEHPGTKMRAIDIIEFFGMHVGYDIPTDTLFYWS